VQVATKRLCAPSHREAEKLALPSGQRTRFQLRRPSEREGGVCCKPELASLLACVNGLRDSSGKIERREGNLGNGFALHPRCRQVGA
jgi:hypothetical protein